LRAGVLGEEIRESGHVVGNTINRSKAACDRRSSRDFTLIAAHPPSADTGAAFYSSHIYLEDGEFDRGESLPGAVGNDAIGAFVRTEEHQAAIDGGLAHFADLPHIELQGDTAFVTSYLQIITPDAKGEPRELSNHGVSTGFRIHRVLANRWTLQRTPEGWRIKSRRLRPLDGSAPARDILEMALEPYRGR
jgi:hypothetical protein